MRLHYEPAARLADASVQSRTASRIWARDISVWGAAAGSGVAAVASYGIFLGLGASVTGQAGAVMPAVCGRQRCFHALRQKRTNSITAATLSPAISPIHMPRAPMPR